MASLLCRKIEYEIRWENTELLNTSSFSWTNPSANTATSAHDVLTLQIKSRQYKKRDIAKRKKFQSSAEKTLFSVS